MPTCTITAYATTSLGLPNMLKKYALSDNICFRIQNYSRSEEMLKTLRGDGLGIEADIALMTWAADSTGQPVGLDDLAGNSIEFTVTEKHLGYTLVAPREDIGNASVVEANWLHNKDIATYLDGERILEQLGIERDPNLCFHEAHDTITINAFVRSGLAYGLAAGYRDRTVAVGPDLISVPIANSPHICSLVAVNAKRLNDEKHIQKIYHDLVSQDLNNPPSWIRQDLGSFLSPNPRNILHRLSEQSKLSQETIIGNSLAMYAGILNRIDGLKNTSVLLYGRSRTRRGKPSVEKFKLNIPEQLTRQHKVHSTDLNSSNRDEENENSGLLSRISDVLT